jgi:hypothetical protein
MGNQEQALTALAKVVQQVARVEPLIDKQYLRFVSTRPAFTDRSRQSILDLFGISPDLLVFVNFEQAFPDVESDRVDNEHGYLSQIQEVFRRFNLEVPHLTSAESGRRTMLELASAVIHVSWQISVCAENPSCDVTLTRPLEHRIFNEILARTTGNIRIAEAGRRRQKTRHVKRLAIGDLPNLSAVGLSVADAVALRHDNVFESFRAELRSALDDLPSTSEDHMKSEAEAKFEEQMLEAARKLRAAAKNSSFRGRVQQAGLPAAMGVVSSAAFAIPTPTGVTPAIFAGLTGAAAATLAQWLLARKKQQAEKVALRYFSSLGGEGVPRFAYQPMAPGF